MCVTDFTGWWLLTIAAAFLISLGYFAAGLTALYQSRKPRPAFAAEPPIPR
jgi:hypothetical protein